MRDRIGVADEERGSPGVPGGLLSRVSGVALISATLSIVQAQAQEFIVRMGDGPPPIIVRTVRTDPAIVVRIDGEGRCGIASWYGGGEKLNVHTASREPFDPKELTAASLSLPLGALARVTRIDTGAAVTVRINDFGPAEYLARTIDLSRVAANALGMMRAGLARVCLEVLQRSAQTSAALRSLWQLDHAPPIRARPLLSPSMGLVLSAIWEMSAQNSGTLNGQ